jgi:Fe2+ or Zn2+ uptake regulation protein
MPPALGQATGLQEIKAFDEISPLVQVVAQNLGERFTQREIHEKLLADGFEVNRSTLRGTLHAMAGAGDTIRIIEPGKGRRATIFGVLSEQAKMAEDLKGE